MVRFAFSGLFLLFISASSAAGLFKGNNNCLWCDQNAIKIFIECLQDRIAQDLSFSSDQKYDFEEIIEGFLISTQALHKTNKHFGIEMDVLQKELCSEMANIIVSDSQLNPEPLQANFEKYFQQCHKLAFGKTDYKFINMFKKLIQLYREEEESYEDSDEEEDEIDTFGEEMINSKVSDERSFFQDDEVFYEEEIYVTPSSISYENSINSGKVQNTDENDVPISEFESNAQVPKMSSVVAAEAPTVSLILPQSTGLIGNLKNTEHNYAYSPTTSSESDAYAYEETHHFLETESDSQNPYFVNTPESKRRIDTINFANGFFACCYESETFCLIIDDIQDENFLYNFSKAVYSALNLLGKSKSTTLTNTIAIALNSLPTDYTCDEFSEILTSLFTTVFKKFNLIDTEDAVSQGQSIANSIISNYISERNVAVPALDFDEIQISIPIPLDFGSQSGNEYNIEVNNIEEAPIPDSTSGSSLITVDSYELDPLPQSQSSISDLVPEMTPSTEEFVVPSIKDLVLMFSLDSSTASNEELVPNNDLHYTNICSLLNENNLPFLSQIADIFASTEVFLSVLKDTLHGIKDISLYYQAMLNKLILLLFSKSSDAQTCIVKCMLQ